MKNRPCELMKDCPLCQGTGEIPNVRENFLRQQYLAFEKAGYNAGIDAAIAAANEMVKWKSIGMVVIRLSSTIAAISALKRGE